MAVKYKDYYATLGVQRTATEQEIKSAYRKLARQFHPDTNQGDKSAEEKFKEIAEAYEVLKDPEKRKRYDMLGANWKAGADFNPPPDFSGFSFDFGGFGKSSPFSEFFDALFGQTFGPQGANPQGATGGPFARARAGDPAKGLDQEAEIELTVEELARGAARNIQVTKPGQGSKNLQVKIPAGVRPGSKVRVPGEAATGMPGGKPGDLYLRVKVKPHPTFMLEGDNIVSELKISPALAVVGGEVTVETLDGQVHINVPALSQTGRMLRLRERGLPKLKQSVRGDHMVRLKVDIPKQVDEQEKELYQQLLNLEKNKG
ncbi:MAG: J domain-containing protein [Candidatus Obscuribacterales bacterium]|nr:J domain-containing protein [Candidatus Obscuribacterales bacterium]